MYFHSARPAPGSTSTTSPCLAALNGFLGYAEEEVVVKDKEGTFICKWLDDHSADWVAKWLTDNREVRLSFRAAKPELNRCVACQASYF